MKNRFIPLCRVLLSLAFLPLAFLLWAFLSQPTFAQDYARNYAKVEDVQAFRTEMKRHASATSSIQAQFVQEKYLSVFSTVVKSTGTFYWKQGNNVCLDYRTPAKYCMVIAGDKIKTTTAGKSNVIDVSGNPMMGQMRTFIAASMAGDLSQVGPDFQITVEKSAADYRITVVPKSKTVSEYISRIEIHINAKDMSVDSLVMHENATDYTKYIFSSKKFNEVIPDSVFSMR